MNNKRNKQTEYDAAAPVVEETERFVCPDAHESLCVERLQRTQRLANAAHPARHLTRTVDVVRLQVVREALLRHQVQLDHRRRERLRDGLRLGTSRGMARLKVP